MDALIGEHGRHIDHGARHHVEATNHNEHHDLHRLADDGCPHHDDDAEHYPMPNFYAAALSGMESEAVPEVVRKSDHGLIPFPGLHLPVDAKERKAIPLCTGVLDYFPDALAAVAEVSRIGNDQHNPGQPLHWSKGKSTDHADCALRHFAERYEVDTDGGLHGAKAAWRMLADLQISIEAKRAGMTYADYIARLKAQEAA
jgi:hypothetical protein